MDPELRAEQAHVDRAYDRLEELERRAVELAEAERRDFSRTPGGLLERDVRERAGLRRRASLHLGSLNLCFGRIDDEGGRTFHLGRVAVADDDQEPLVVDWRAPVAEPFYRATAAEPLGVRRRRHLITKGRRVLRLDDELLAGGSAGAAVGDDLVLVGEAALLDALRQARTGRMGDIVSTIQAEQDRIIRAPLGGVVVVQGGPGTGKTAVALHRAAYLLYTHRFPLEQLGVLFIGPNPVFLRYIERVLPTLGESGCRMATVGELVTAAGQATVEEAPAAARLKGDVRMAEVVARAVRSRQRPLRKAVTIPLGAFGLRIGRRASTAVVEQVAALPGTHNSRRAAVEALVHRHLRRQYLEAVGRAEAAGLAPRALPDDDLDDALRASQDVRRVLHRIWPVLTPERLLDDLLGSAALLAEAADGLLDADEQAQLVRPRAAADAAPAWSGADLPLLDEAAPLLGPPPARRRARRAPSAGEDVSAIVDRALADVVPGGLPECPECGSELSHVGGAVDWRCERLACGHEWSSAEVLSPQAASLLHKVRQRLEASVSPAQAEAAPALRTYGHVIVDEAQDLSPMQWRMLARRCPSGSMTIVGDLGQASGNWAPASWEDVIALVPTPRSSVVELTVNYRTPSEVMAVAARVLAASRPDLRAARSVRDAGVAPTYLPVARAAVAVSAVSTAAAEAAHVDGGKVAVIVPVALLDEVRRLVVADPRLAGEGEDVLAAPVSALTLDEAKGLEFDSVVVVDPAAIAAEHPHGLGALYVALTRTTTRLVVVHSGDLPPELAA